MDRRGRSVRFPFFSFSVHQTFVAGSALSRQIKKGTPLLLKGSVGSGKTHLAKGLISALTGLPKEDIVSPTYALKNEYRALCGARVIHYDLYLSQEGALGEDFWEDFEDPFAYVLIEWGEGLFNRQTASMVEISIVDRFYRSITFYPILSGD